MALITLRQLLDHAAEPGYGVPAFNINTLEQGLAILKAAAAVDAPVILQASRGARSYAGDIMLRRMVEALAEMKPNIPICLHQDHGNNLATCMSAIRHGFTSVMMDGSLHEDMKTPADYDHNVAMAELTALCRDRFERFGTAGQASQITIIAMDEMAKRHASGTLDPAITGAKAA